MIARRTTHYPAPQRGTDSGDADTASQGTVNRGSATGVMSDGRPFRLDVWSRGEIWMFMFHFSSIGLETLDAAALGRLLEREALVAIRDRSIEWLSAHTRDARGHLMHGVGTVARDARGTYVELLVPLGEP